MKAVATLAILLALSAAHAEGRRLDLGTLVPGMSQAEVERVFPGVAPKCLEVQGKTVCGYSVTAADLQPLAGERVLRWDLILDDDRNLDFVLAQLAGGSFDRVAGVFGKRYGEPVETRDDERGQRIRVAWDGGNTAMAVMRTPKGKTLAVLTSHRRLETFVNNVQGGAGIRPAGNSAPSPR